MGSNPGAIYWMDMTYFHIYLLLFKLFCIVKTKNKQKEAGVGPFLKHILIEKSAVFLLEIESLSRVWRSDNQVWVTIPVQVNSSGKGEAKASKLWVHIPC